MPDVISPELLKTLCCPESRQPVTEAGPDPLARVNHAIRAGRAKDRDGQPVVEVLDCALIRQDRKLLYPVRQGIPVLLAGASIDLDEVESRNPPPNVSKTGG